MRRPRLDHGSTAILLGTALLFAVMVFLGVRLIRHQRDYLRTRAENDLIAIGTLKVNQFTQWRENRLQEGATLLLHPTFRRGAFQWLGTQAPPPGWTTKVKDRLQTLGYEDLLFLSPGGDRLWSATGMTSQSAEEEIRSLKAALQGGAPVLTDFYRHPGSPVIHCSVVVPLRDPASGREAGLILVSNSKDNLYPLIQSWPVPSDSAETLLVERQGDHVLFLNELRHQKDTALTLKFTLSHTEIPAVQAALGRKGIFEGRDYRGVESVSVLSEVPGTPWAMVAKMDAKEAFEPASKMTRLLASVMVALLAMELSIGLLFRVWWRNLQRGSDTESRFQRMIDQVTDYAILALDPKGIVATWNAGARRIKGYEASEILGRSFTCFFTEEDRQANKPANLLLEAATAGHAVEESWRVRKDGSKFWGSVMITPICDKSGRLLGFSNITRDRTERKAAEDRILKLTRMYATLSQANEAIIRSRSPEDLFGKTTRICVESGLFDLAWIGVPDDTGEKVRIAAVHGPWRAYLDDIEITLDAKHETGQGPTGISFRDARPVIVQDWNADTSVAPWRSRGAAFGIQASASFPLLQEDKSVAVLTLYSREVGFFEEDRLHLLNELARDLSYALDMLAGEQRRILAEAELRASEAKYRNALDNMLEGCQIIGSDWRYLYINEIAEAHNRRPKEEMLGQTVMECWPGITTLEIFTLEKKCMEMRTTHRLENEFRFADGRTGYFNIILLSVPEGIAIYSEDITERKMAESILMAEHYLGIRLGECTRLNEGLSLCLETAMNISGMDSGGIYLAQPTTGVMELVVHQGLSPETLQATSRCPAGVGAAGSCGAGNGTFLCVMDGRPLFIDHAALGLDGEDPRLREGLHAIAILPIRQEDRVQGCLSLGSHQLEEVHPYVRISLEKLGSQTGAFVARLQAQEALQRYADQLEALVETRTAHLIKLSKAIEQSPVMVVITDFDGIIEYMNPRFTEVTGYTAEEALGKNPRILNSGLHSKAFYREMWETLAAGKEWRGVFHNRAKDGHLYMEQASISPVRDPDGKITHYVAVKEDITEQIKIAEELHRAYQRLELVLDSSSDGIYGIDLDGDCTFINRTAIEALGYSIPEEVLGRNNHKLFHHSHIDQSPYAVEDCPINGVLQGRESFPVNTEVYWRKDGTPLPIQYETRPLLEEGKIRGAVVTFSDITVRIRTEEALVRAKNAAESATQAKSIFLSNMSHEIRTPLNAVLGFSQLLLRERGLNKRQMDYLGTINRAGDHLLNLINEVLELARIEAGRTSISEESLDLPRFIGDLAQMFRIKAHDKDLSLEFGLRPGVPRHVLADAHKLRQILINLLGNAVKFTSTGTISLDVQAEPRATDTQEDGYRLHFDVKDTGPGIAPEDLERLFSAFEQTAVGASKGGAGLGLAISQHYARMMRGGIEVHSEVGKGTCFRLSLDLKPGKSVPVLPVLPRVARLCEGQTKRRVLIVDDREDNRVLLRELLNSAGFRTLEAFDGQKALEAFEAWPPDAILMDVHMPGMDGLEAIRRIKATNRGCGLPIIAMSASALDVNQREALAAGADAFVPKPFQEAKLFETLGRFLGLEYEELPQEMEYPAAPPDGPEPALDSDLLSRLRLAAARARYDELLEMIEAIKAERPRIAAQLQDFAENFDYPGLIAFLDAYGVSHG